MFPWSQEAIEETRERGERQDKSEVESEASFTSTRAVAKRGRSQVEGEASRSRGRRSEEVCRTPRFFASARDKFSGRDHEVTARRED